MTEGFYKILFDTQTVLILIALMSAIVGTLWNARHWAKGIIIVLAIATAGTAILESKGKIKAKEDAEKDAASAKRTLELVVRSVQPPAIFNEAVLQALRENADESGMFISDQMIREDGSRLFKFKHREGENGLAGVVYVGVDTLQELLIAFAQGITLASETSKLLSGKWGDDDLNNSWDTFALTTYEIARFALGRIKCVRARN